MSTIYDGITPDDLRILIETEDEYARRGNFERIFPSDKNYCKYFQTPRYYNILLKKWIDEYKDKKTEGNLHEGK